MSATKYICGIDPGFSGAIAIIDLDGKIHHLIDMPVLMVGSKSSLDEVGVRQALVKHELSHVFIEKAGCMPKQGISSTSRYMASWGIIIGICVGLYIPYTLMTPQSWKKEMMAGMGKEKEASIARVKQLYPGLDLNRKKDHGKADAVLIANYARRLGI